MTTLDGAGGSTMDDADVLIVRKRSARERHGSDLEKHRESHDALMRVVASLVDVIESSGLRATVMTIDELMDSGHPLHKSGSSGCQGSGGLRPRQRLAVAVGGDGTLLHTSHYIGGSTRLLGINAVPRLSVGHLCLARDSTLAASVRKVLEDQIEPRRVARLEVQPFSGAAALADDQQTARRLPEPTAPAPGTRHPFSDLPLALNDILFCNNHPAASSRYALNVLHRDHATPQEWVVSCRENHISSGIWIATAAGSTAAISSYGLQRLPLESNRFLIAVREPYFRPESLCTLTRASLDGAHQSVVIESHMPAALVAVDGADFSATLHRNEAIWLRMLPSNDLLLYI